MPARSRCSRARRCSTSIVIDGTARGIVARDLVTGEIDVAHRRRRHSRAPAATATSIYLSTNAKGSNATAIWRAHKRGALFANPCFTQIHPTCIPVSGDYQSKLTLMSESLRNDGRIWVPRRRATSGRRTRSRKTNATIIWSAAIPASATSCPATSLRAMPRRCATRAAESARAGLGVYLDFSDAINRLGETSIRERYGNLFDMYQRITGREPLQGPDAHLPCHPLHHGRPVGGLQPAEHHPRAVCARAKPTSPTTAPIAWARAR